MTLQFNAKYAMVAKRLVLLSQIAYGGKLLLLFAFMVSTQLLSSFELPLLIMLVLSSVASLAADIVSDRWFEKHSSEEARQKELRSKIALTGATHVASSLILISAVIFLYGLGLFALIYPVPLAISAVMQMFPKIWGADQKKASRLSWIQQAWILLSIFAVIVPQQL